MPSRRSRRTFRALCVAGIGAATVLTLSGCFSVTADIAIDSDANTSGTVAVGFQKSAMSMLGMTFDDFAKDFADKLDDPSGTSGETDGFDPASCTPSETASEFVMTCDITGGSGAIGEDFTVTKSGDTITLHMIKRGLGDLAGSGGPRLDDLFGGSGPLSGLGGGNLPSELGDLLGGAGKLMSGATYTVNVKFPGDITSITGEFVEQTSDTSVSISAALTQALDVSVTSNSRPGGRGIDARTVVLILLIVAVAVLGLAVIALLVVLVWLLSRRSAAASPHVVAPPAGEVGGPPVAPPTVELPKTGPEERQQ